jgi:hypothetical protein
MLTIISLHRFAVILCPVLALVFAMEQGKVKRELTFFAVVLI